MADRKAEIIQYLQESHRTLHAILDRIQADQWEQVIQDEDQHWTARQILAHIVSTQRGTTLNIMTINVGKEGASADFDLNRWNKSNVEKSTAKTPQELLAELDQGHQTVLQAVERLKDSDLDKRGRHGDLRILSLEELARIIGDHEVDHGKTIADKLGLN